MSRGDKRMDSGCNGFRPHGSGACSDPVQKTGPVPVPLKHSTERVSLVLSSGIGIKTFRRAFLLIAAAALVCGCASLPELIPVTGVSRAEMEKICRRPFPDRPWRAVHALHISGPFGHQSSVMGVTIVDPTSRRIRAVILSLEGLVLFDASSGEGTVNVRRAVPPLDRKGFPEGLLHDVSLMCLAPEGSPAETGLDQEGHPVCRWRDESSGTTELVTVDVGNWRIRQYESDRDLKREVVLTAERGAPLPGEIRFVCHGLAGYSLDLTLIEAEFLSGEYETLFIQGPE